MTHEVFRVSNSPYRELEEAGNVETAARRLRWWMHEGLPERLHRLRFRLNPWARARQYRTERDAYMRWLNDCESRQT